MSSIGSAPWRLRAAAAALGLVASLLLFELACQVFARARIFPPWDELMGREHYFYQRSDSPILAYELAPNRLVQSDGRTLRINAHGIREDSNDLFSDQLRVAILGDSVVFGFAHDQSKTISAYLQRLLDPGMKRMKALNFGLGGLNLEELAEFFRRHNATYDVDEVIFLINPNDFAPRNSIYEGADNGLYRIYQRPVWMGRWFVRKAVYRYNKRGAVSLHWYEWMFAGNEQWGYEQLRSLAEYCRERGIHFGVVLLPSAYAFAADSYALEHLNAPIREFLTSIDVRFVDPVKRFRAGADQFYDATDHFLDAGNVEMAKVMLKLVKGSRRRVDAPRRQ
jgi:hypothetical protein